MNKTQNQENIKLLENKLELDKLMSENYYPVNIAMVKYLGIEPALFFSAAYEQMEFMGADLSKDNTLSVRTISEKTGLSSVKQKKAIEVLKQHKLIDVYIRPGYPKVRKISFNLLEIENLKKELENFRIQKYTEQELAKYEFKRKVERKKQEFCIEQRRKEENEQWYRLFPELKELTDDPSTYIQEHREWWNKRYGTPSVQPARRWNGFSF